MKSPPGVIKWQNRWQYKNTEYDVLKMIITNQNKIAGYLYFISAILPRLGYLP